MGAVFLPVRIRLVLGIDRSLPDPLLFELRIWGIRILRIPDSRSRRSGWVGRKLARWIESFLVSSKDRDESSPPSPVEKTRKPMSTSFVLWAARRGMVLVGRLTRRFELSCAGIDPALLGTLTGVFAIVQGALGVEKFGWAPDFTPGTLRVRLGWDLSISVWKLVKWVGETFSDRKRPVRKRSGFVVS